MVVAPLVLVRGATGAMAHRPAAHASHLATAGAPGGLRGRSAELAAVAALYVGGSHPGQVGQAADTAMGVATSTAPTTTPTTVPVPVAHVTPTTAPPPPPPTTTTTAPPPPPPPTTTTTAPPPPPAPAHSEIGIVTYYAATPGTCASPSLPFGTVVTVTNPANGRSVRCTVDDREADVGRAIDLATSTFALIAPLSQGIITDAELSW